MRLTATFLVRARRFVNLAETYLLGVSIALEKTWNWTENKSISRWTLVKLTRLQDQIKESNKRKFTFFSFDHSVEMEWQWSFFRTKNPNWMQALGLFCFEEPVDIWGLFSRRSCLLRRILLYFGGKFCCLLIRQRTQKLNIQSDSKRAKILTSYSARSIIGNLDALIYSDTFSSKNLFTNCPFL